METATKTTQDAPDINTGEKYGQTTDADLLEFESDDLTFDDGEEGANEPSEATDEATDEQTPEKASDEQVEGTDEKPDEAEADEKPAKPHALDKGIVKLQQEQTTLARQQEEIRAQQEAIAAQLQQVLEAVQKPTGAEKPKDTADEQVSQEAEADIESLLADLDGDELVDGNVLRTSLAKIAKTLKSSRSGDADKKLAALEEQLREMRQAEDNAKVDRVFREQFSKDHPTVASDYDSMVSEAVKRLDAEFPDFTGDARQGAFSAIWKQVVTDHESKAPKPTKTESSKSKPKETPPLSNQPPQSTNGTKTGAHGASARPAATDMIGDDDIGDIPRLDDGN